MNVLLCVVIIVLGLGVFLGYKQGLIKMIATLLVATLAVSLVSFVSPYISKWIQEKTSIQESVQNTVVKILVSEEEEDILEKSVKVNSLSEGVVLPPVFDVVIKKKLTKVIPANLDIPSILPRGLPEMCFATIGINAGGHSKSAKFARERLRTKRPIIFCDEIETREGSIYLLIIRNDMILHDFPLGAVVHCEENNDYDTDVKNFIFNVNETNSPCFTFDSLLRSAIKKAARQIVPFDLTELFVNEAVTFIASFQFEYYKSAFIKAIKSYEFMKHVVPFDHMLITRSDMYLCS